MVSDEEVRPVVALDVDGVLNAAIGPEHIITIPAAALPKSPFIFGEGYLDLTLALHLDEALGPWITALRERAVVVWASTWEGAANSHLAPLLGIDPLPVGATVEDQALMKGHATGWGVVEWKAAALADRYAGRPLVWVDDLAGPYTPQAAELERLGRVWWDWRVDRDVHARRRAAPTLVLVPNPLLGITAGDRELVTEWVADPWRHPHPVGPERRPTE